MNLHSLPIKENFSLSTFQVTAAQGVQSTPKLHINMFCVNLSLLSLLTIEKFFCAPIYCTNLSETSSLWVDVIWLKKCHECSELICRNHECQLGCFAVTCLLWRLFCCRRAASPATEGEFRDLPLFIGQERLNYCTIGPFYCKNCSEGICFCLKSLQSCRETI